MLPSDEGREFLESLPTVKWTADMKDEAIALLRGLADEIQHGTFNFNDGDVLQIGVHLSNEGTSE